MDGLNNIVRYSSKLYRYWRQQYEKVAGWIDFPMSELSVMGFIEIFLQYKNLKERLNHTVVSILDEKPDILLTIDAPEFCFRVAKK